MLTHSPSYATERRPVGDSPVSLLLIEDSPHDVELVLAVLERGGYRVDAHVVRDQRSMIEALSARAYDLIVSDYILPGFSGGQALQVARRMALETPFLFLSGVFGEEHAVEMMRQGAVDYVLKQNLSLLPKAVGRALAEVHERRERRRVTDELQQAEIRARLAMDASNQGLWDYEPQSGRLIWDARCKALYGLSETAQVDMRLIEERCHPDDRERLLRDMAQAMSCDQADAYHVEYRVVLPGGEERWLSTRGRAFFDSGVCTRFVGVLMDITPQKRAREALEQLNEVLGERVERRTRERNRTWELSSDLLAVLNQHSCPVALNPAWETLLCWPRDTLLNTSLLALLHPEDVAASQQEMEQLRQGKVTTRFVSRLRHADGSYHSISWGAVPDEGEIYLVGRDITSEIAIIDELAAANARLREQIEERERVEATLQQMQRLEAVGQLTAGVAHDFNNLLTVILINATFLDRDLARSAAPDKIASRLQNIREAGQRGARLTSQLLSFSRRQRLTPEPVNLSDTVLGMLDLLRSSLGGGIWVETDTCAELWQALVDPTQIELIILNLAINARDAMEGGGALRLVTRNETVTAPPTRAEDPEPGDYVVLAVCDSGSGMSEEVLAKAFEPFFTTKEIGKGSGLGLAQVFGFAKQSGGGARIDTAPGRGTTVKVYLPRAVAAAPNGHRATGPAPADEVPGGPGCGILLVDDDPDVREVTALMLEEMEFQVTTADSGAKALAMLEQGAAFDLLLADFAMPGMNGAELAEHVRARHPDLPVVFVTGYAEFGRLNPDENAVVQKPFTEEQLRRALHQALRRSRTCGKAGRGAESPAQA